MRREMTDGLTDGWTDDVWVVGQQQNAREI